MSYATRLRRYEYARQAVHKRASERPVPNHTHTQSDMYQKREEDFQVEHLPFVVSGFSLFEYKCAFDWFDVSSEAEHYSSETAMKPLCNNNDKR